MKQFIFLLFLFFSNVSVSKEIEKKIRFHPPETEAERALDVILRIDNDIIKGKNNDQDTFTKDFLIADDIQAKIAHNEDPETPCLLADSGRNCGFLTGGNDTLTNIGFLYYTNKTEGDIIYIYVVPMGYNGAINEFNRQEYVNNNIAKQNNIAEQYRFKYDLNYAMKKEDSKWKIDGICVSDKFVNHKYCIDPKNHHDYIPKFSKD